MISANVISGKCELVNSSFFSLWLKGREGPRGESGEPGQPGIRGDNVSRNSYCFGFRM